MVSGDNDMKILKHFYAIFFRNMLNGDCVKRLYNFDTFVVSVLSPFFSNLRLYTLSCHVCSSHQPHEVN